MKKGSKHSEETKRKMSESRSGKNNPMYGKKRTMSEETRKKMSESHKGKSSGMKGKKLSKESRKRMSERMMGKKNPMYGKKKIVNKKTRKKMSDGSILKLHTIYDRYSFFSKVEEVRYNPDKLVEKEIQVHCKNHNCLNSKEQGGWFTPTKSQLSERIRQLEHPDGNGGSYFYCSEFCKESCILYNLRSDPFKNTKKYYTDSEYQTFRKFVLERDNYMCQFCNEPAFEVHHERPQKLEPFFALDPDYAWSCCKKCHYEKGHVDNCSYGKLASVICKS
jgi:hypothetical protein